MGGQLPFSRPTESHLRHSRWRVNGLYIFERQNTLTRAFFIFPVDNSQNKDSLKNKDFFLSKSRGRGNPCILLHIVLSTASRAFGLGLANAVHAKVDSKLSKIVSPEIR